MKVNGTQKKYQTPTWRGQAVSIVEELFPATAAPQWDALLDLREALVRGNDWRTVIDRFLHCRSLMESDHYLPFYRLRRLLAGSLRLEAAAGPEVPMVDDLERLLRGKHRSLAELERAIQRHCFEFGHPAPADTLKLDVVERDFDRAC